MCIPVDIICTYRTKVIMSCSRYMYIMYIYINMFVHMYKYVCTCVYVCSTHIPVDPL